EYIYLMGEFMPERRRGLFTAHQYYIQLSKQEGMAMSVAEAMQKGMVCFVTRVGGINQYAIAGYSAIYIDTSDNGTWEASMERIMEIICDSERCERISKAAYLTFKNMPVFSDSLIEAIFRYAK